MLHQKSRIVNGRRISQSEIQNSAAAEKRGRAKIPSPQPPSFLPARAIGFQNSQSGFSSKKVRILFKTDSQFVKFAFPASLGASPLASADKFSNNFQTSQSFVPPKAGRKVAILCPKAITNLIK